jgi:dTDP-glucose 4,6-dehydratase
MRTVVTGGAGFLGSHLCEALVARGDTVVCLDSLLTGRMENLESLSGRDRFAFVRHDVTASICVEGKVDAVLHLASPASPVDYLKFPIQTLKVGSLGTHKTLGLAKGKGARFLLASTSEVYGDPQVHPQQEDYWGHVNPVGYRGVYDEAKRFAEAMVMAYHRVHGLDTRIVRIFNTYGPRMRLDDGRALPTFISQALRGEPLTVYGDGQQTRSFCYVDDLVAGLLCVLGSAETRPVNVGNPEEISVLQMAEEVIRLSASASAVRRVPFPKEYTDDPKVRRPDISRARGLGWTPRITREEGIRRTLDHYRRRGTAK